MIFCADDAVKLDYLNGMLGAGERARFEEHLASCPECRREIAELRETAAAVASLTPPLVSAAWKTAAKEKLRRKKSAQVSGRRWAGIVQYAGITAGVTAGLVLAFWMVMKGAVQRGLSSFSISLIGISESHAARSAGLVIWILSLFALFLIPSIIDNIYRIVRRSSPRNSHGNR